MVAIIQSTLSNTSFFGMKMYQLWSRFHWSLLGLTELKLTMQTMVFTIVSVGDTEPWMRTGCCLVSVLERNKNIQISLLWTSSASTNRSHHKIKGVIMIYQYVSAMSTLLTFTIQIGSAYSTLGSLFVTQFPYQIKHQISAVKHRLKTLLFSLKG